MNLAKNWVDSEQDRSPGLFSVGQEVGQAGEHHNVGVFPHGPQGLGKEERDGRMGAADIRTSKDNRDNWWSSDDA